MDSADTLCSYNEALPWMLSIPLYTVSEAHTVFVDHYARLGTFNHIRNLTMGQYFYTPPDDAFPQIYPHSSYGWDKACATLASMTSLRYLCIYVIQRNVVEYFQTHSQHENVKLVADLLNPMKPIKVSEGGVFDVIAQGWTVPDGAADDMPFRVVQEKPPTVTDLRSRTQELGEFSHNSYVKLASMPWPLHRLYF